MAVGDGSHGTTVAVDVGPKVVHGKSTEGWQWYDTLFGKIHMDTKTVFFDSSGVPASLEELITPLGRLPPLGNATTVYSNFTAGPIDQKLFDISDIDTCPMSSKCSQDEPTPTRSSIWQKVWSTKWEHDA